MDVRVDGLAVRLPALVQEVRGRGYLVGLALKVDHLPLVTLLREKGMLVIPTAGQVIRLLPPLTATLEELSRSVELFAEALSAYKPA